MITFGVDAHKQIHVAIGVDESGREIGRWQGPNSALGWKGVLEWATALGEARDWGIEGAWNYGRGLAQALVASGETVYEVNPRWTATGRRRARQPDKTDRHDAQAVARCVRQEAPNLPRVAVDDVTAILDLVTCQREELKIETTRLVNQLHALLLQTDSEYKSHLPSLTSEAGVAVLEAYQSPTEGALAKARAAGVRRLAQRLRLAREQAKELAKQIEALTAEAGFTPLTAINGIGLLIAGTLAGILGPGCRFASDAQLAAYAGVAPLEASSAGMVRHRLNRGGNRRLNSQLHMIAITQLRSWPPARDYVKRRMSEGKTHREAVRALKRYLVRAIWRAWKECLPASTQMSASQVARA
jgi:transposase